MKTMSNNKIIPPKIWKKIAQIIFISYYSYWIEKSMSNKAHRKMMMMIVMKLMPRELMMWKSMDNSIDRCNLEIWKCNLFQLGIRFDLNWFNTIRYFELHCHCNWAQSLKCRAVNRNDSNLMISLCSIQCSFHNPLKTDHSFINTICIYFYIFLFPSRSCKSFLVYILPNCRTLLTVISVSMEKCSLDILFGSIKKIKYLLFLT